MVIASTKLVVRDHTHLTTAQNCALTHIQAGLSKLDTAVSAAQSQTSGIQ